MVPNLHNSIFSKQPAYLVARYSLKKADGPSTKMDISSVAVLISAVLCHYVGFDKQM